MNENDRKLLAEVLRCARDVVAVSECSCCGEQVDMEAGALQSALDRYDLRAEDRIA